MSHRVAVLEKDDCHSKKCGLECINFCPVNKNEAECIVLGADGKAVISEDLCTGCGICVKKCPFEAITIVNLAEELAVDKVHQYGVNAFRLYRLPVPKKGAVVGLVGRNGVGKTTALNILAGNLKPNLGRLEAPPDWDEVITNFRGTELKSHFRMVADDRLRVSVKPQAVYLIPHVWKSSVRSLLKQVDERGESDLLVSSLDLEQSSEKNVSELSGGELQRLAVAVAAAKEADLYLFDEPSSYNDVFQRLSVSRAIARLAERGMSVVLVEHDLTMLDYLSDYVHILYGEAGAYGIVSGVQSTRTGLNVLLDGYLPGENIRFRDSPVKFEVSAPLGDSLQTAMVVEYSGVVKRFPGFELRIGAGGLRAGEVVGILGGNALGKTTFMKIVANIEKCDEGFVHASATISYKPQYLSASYEGSVEELSKSVSREALDSGAVQAEIVEPLGLRKLMDHKVKDLSGGELQRVAIASCLLREAEVYALDEPSAFIDVEDRIVLAKAIQRFVKSRGRSALIVDHDVQLVDIVSDSLMVFSGVPSAQGFASSPMPKERGMNHFLKGLGITYRRDVESGRPRVNKPASKLDREQKASGMYYYVSRA